MIRLNALLRYALSGGLATASHVLVFVLLVEFLGVRPLLAVVPAFACALLVSYGMNYHWTFSASGMHRVLLPRYVVVAFIGLALNLGITYVVVDVAHYWYGYALLLVVVLVPLVTFMLSKFWVFHEPRA